MIECYGELSYGELPPQYDFSIPDPYAGLLSDPNIQLVYLVELSPYNPLITKTLSGNPPYGSTSYGEEDIIISGGYEQIYLSDLGFTTTPTDTLPDTHFKALVDNPLQTELSIISGNDFTNGGASFGSIVITNADGILDAETGLYWSGRRAVVKAGKKGIPYSAFKTVFDGAVSDLDSDDLKITLTIQDKRNKLDQALNRSIYSGTGGTEGGADLEGKVKPLCFGKVLNIEPLLVDSVNLVYQLNDGTVLEVSAVRDAGVHLTPAGDVADITLASPAAGEFVTQLSGGYIKLGSSPAGRITADARQSADDTPSDIAQYVVTNLLGGNNLSTDEIDGGAFASLGLTGSMGLYYPEQVSAVEVLDALFLPCAAYWCFTRIGVLTVGTIEAPGVETISYDLDDIEFEGIQRLSTITPTWKISVAYAPLGTIQSEDELAGGTTEDDRAFLTQSDRLVTSENDYVRTINAQAIERTFYTRLTEKADATALLDRLRSVYETPRRMFRVPLVKGLFLASIGDTVKLTYPRHALQNGQNFRIVSIGEDAESGSTTLVLWG